MYFTLDRARGDGQCEGGLIGRASEAGLPRGSAKRPIRLAGSRAGTRRLTNCHRCRVPSRSAWRTVDLTPSAVALGRCQAGSTCVATSAPETWIPRVLSFSHLRVQRVGCREGWSQRMVSRRWSGCTPPPKAAPPRQEQASSDPTSSAQIIPYIMNTMLTKVVRSVTGPRSSVSRLNSARRNLRVQATISQVRLSACLLELSGIPLP